MDTNAGMCIVHAEMIFRSLRKSVQSFKGTGTQDLIWLKVVSLDRSWLVGLKTTFKNF